MAPNLIAAGTPDYGVQIFNSATGEELASRKLGEANLAPDHWQEVRSVLFVEDDYGPERRTLVFGYGSHVETWA